jgi:hypothetical protein
MTNADLMTTEFPITLPDGTVLTVQKLSVIGEQKLFQELASRLLTSFGPGGYFANAKPALDWLQSQGMGAAYAQAVSDLTRLTATRALPDMQAVDDFRQTPDGLAAELFLRTRKTHPDLAEPLIRTQLNPLTAWQVATALWEGLASDHKRRSALAGDVA